MLRTKVHEVAKSKFGVVASNCCETSWYVVQIVAKSKFGAFVSNCCELLLYVVHVVPSQNLDQLLNSLWNVTASPICADLKSRPDFGRPRITRGDCSIRGLPTLRVQINSFIKVTPCKSHLLLSLSKKGYGKHLQ